MNAIEIATELMRESDRRNDMMQSRWHYTERKVNQGREARLVYDIRADDLAAGPGIQGLSSEAMAAYIVALHNESMDRLVIV